MATDKNAEKQRKPRLSKKEQLVAHLQVLIFRFFMRCAFSLKNSLTTMTGPGVKIN